MSDVVIVVNRPPVPIILVQESPTTVVVTTGFQGPPGVGVPAGGTTAQVLAKNSGVSGDSSWYDVGKLPDLVALGLEKGFDYAYAHYFTKFTFSLGVLTDIDVYTSPAMTTKLFNKNFVYSGPDLSTIVTTRISDSSTLTKTFTYTLGVLTSINRT